MVLVPMSNVVQFVLIYNYFPKLKKKSELAGKVIYLSFEPTARD